MTKPGQRGFTLVELSIVLVIIGLLIGGILVAQSMIATAKINSTVRQIQQYDIAVSNFQSRFKSLPGDSTKFDPPGNGDGYITDHSVPGDDNYFGGEISNFWPHLYQGGDIDKLYSNAVSWPNPVVVGVNCPKISLGDNSGLVAGVSTHVSDHQVFGEVVNAYTIAKHQQPAGGHYMGANPSVPVADALALDQKMDDGAANAGNVRAVGFWNEDLYEAADDTAGSGCVVNGSTAQYNVNSTAKTPCGLAVKMFSQTSKNSN